MTLDKLRTAASSPMMMRWSKIWMSESERERERSRKQKLEETLSLLLHGNETFNQREADQKLTMVRLGLGGWSNGGDWFKGKPQKESWPLKSGMVCMCCDHWLRGLSPKRKVEVMYISVRAKEHRENATTFFVLLRNCPLKSFTANRKTIYSILDNKSYSLWINLVYYFTVVRKCNN